MAAADKERAREKGKEKENGGEGGKFGQQFARVFLPQLYGERLKIPPSFNQYLQDQPTGVVSLKGQSGNTWLAELASDNEGLFFVKGWKEFVRDHSIEMGHFLTFRYDGRSKFSVVIFDGMCIEKPSAFHAKPCKNLVVKIESGKGDMDINAADPSQASAAPLEETDPPEAVVVPLEESNQTTRKRIREIDANDSALQKSLRVREIDANGSALQKSLRVREIDANDSALQKSSRVREIDANDSALQSSRVREIDANETALHKSSRVREIDANDSALHKSSRVREIDANDSALHKSSRVREIDANDSALQKSSRVREIDANDSSLQKSSGLREIDANDSALQKSSIASDKDKKRCPAASVGTYKSASTSLDSTEDSDSSSSMLEQSISCIKSELTSPIRLGVSKDVARRGQNSATGKRQLRVLSQRRLVTEIQKDNALLRAKQFKSKNPFGLQIMKESYVYVGFFLNLPCEFVRECLPRAHRKLKLWNPQGKSWDVNYVYYSERCVGGLSGGWGKFSLDNNLEKFDVCVFELFSKDNIKVHIYRVVPEITPFLPGPGKK
uniref:B3 domain-containing protein n=1 Tax=Aegilops tauschii TaxID=37682 RepID=M8BW15_AEGTA